MYTRQKGDDLLSKDKRLKYKWEWSRVASCCTDKELKKWTHFQTSKCRVGNWTLEACQWGYDNNVTYTSSINYVDNSVEGIPGFKTRVEAQIAAEKLLYTWLDQQLEITINNMARPIT